MVKNLRDLSVGNICETRDNGWYAIFCDEGGRKAIFNERGCFGRIDETQNMVFDDGKKEVVRVYGFTQTLPALDQISEAIKFLYETRHNTKALHKLWEAEPEEATEIKREIKRLTAQKSETDKKLSSLYSALPLIR